MTGRPKVEEMEKAIAVTIRTKDLKVLDGLIHSELGPSASTDEQGKRRRQYLGALIRGAAPRSIMDLGRRVEGEIERLTERVESIEIPYLDFVSELLLLQDSLKNIESQTLADILRRLDSLEGK